MVGSQIGVSLGESSLDAFATGTHNYASRRRPTLVMGHVGVAQTRRQREGGWFSVGKDRKGEALKCTKSLSPQIGAVVGVLGGLFM